MKSNSPVEKFPGYIVLPDYLILPQVRTFENALSGLENIPQNDGFIRFGVLDEHRLPVVLECVQEWHIEGVPENPTVDTFPLTPKRAASDLLKWAFEEVSKVYIGEIEVPNE